MIKEIKGENAFIEFFRLEENCKKFLAYKRWNGGNPICPHCGHNNAYTYADGISYRCSSKACDKKFSIRTGTIFADSRIMLRDWFRSIYKYLGICISYPTTQLAEDLIVTLDTALFIHHRVMYLCRINYDKLIQKNGVFETDGTGIGADTKMMNLNTLNTWGNLSGHNHRMTFQGVLQRGGRLYLKAMLPYNNSSDISEFVSKIADNSSTIYSDQGPENADLKNHFANTKKVIHRKGDFGRKNSDCHTNHIERAWKNVKSNLKHYVRVRERYAQLYAYEQAAIYSLKTLSKMTAIERFDAAFENINDSRITKNELKAFGDIEEIRLRSRTRRGKLIKPNTHTTVNVSLARRKKRNKANSVKGKPRGRPKKTELQAK